MIFSNNILSVFAIIYLDMRKNIPLYMQTASHKVISIKTGFMYKIMHESCFYGIIKKAVCIRY